MERYEDDAAFIRALAELLRETELTEIKVKRSFGEDDELEVRVARQAEVVTVQAAAPAPAPAAPAPAAAPATPAAAEPAGPEAVAALPGAVTSPMVGVAYLQPEPGAAPFVQIGDQVAEGQTVLIIEAMKTMNQIPAPHSGTVKRILVEDGAPVEYGAPLLVLE
ncbi:MAG: acetyl-CoA carboxylase biotin carboxyl carrier protein [Pseudomonadota bacterium]